MQKAKRIIACLDIQNGRTVKGINFENITDAGDPAALAVKYCEDGADELVFLDITATLEKRKTFFELVEKLAPLVPRAFTVGGGINSLADMETLLQLGAAKISMNTAAFYDPSLISAGAKSFGSEHITIAIDTALHNNEWVVVVSGGKQITNIRAKEWAQRVCDLGAGEILLTSMNHDGTGKGFALDITGEIADSVSVPVIASGGAGNQNHFRELFEKTNAAAALGAGIFHRNELKIGDLKLFLSNSSIPVFI